MDNFYKIYEILNKIDNPIIFVSTLSNLYHCFVENIDIRMIKINSDDKNYKEILLYKNEKEILEDKCIEQYYLLNNVTNIKITSYIGENTNEEDILYLKNLHNTLFNLYQLKVYQEKIRKMEITDMITNIFNTKGLIHFGEELQEKGLLKNYAFILLNLKNFKYINERVGTECGNILLKEYAQKIKSLLKPDENIGRLGGDSFAIIIKEKNVNNLLLNIQDFIIRPIEDEEISCKLSYRCGISIIKEDIQKALKEADLALKTLRQNDNIDVMYYTEEMKTIFDEYKDIEIGFQKALEEKEFVITYQPKVNAKNYYLCGGEALVRWKKDGKYVLPNKFIPILEKDMSICELDMYVLEQVCQDIRKWLDEGLKPPKISINFSKNHFNKGDFASEILKVLKKYDIDSKYVEIELTETSAYYAKEVLSTFIKVMQHNNISVSMDDFGTGDSSLNLLKTLQFDIIKFDKTFIDGILSECDKDRILLTNLMVMINKLGMLSVAEGVETVEQVEFLKNIGCDVIQGYFFDKPLSREDFEERIRAKKD